MLSARRPLTIIETKEMSDYLLVGWRQIHEALFCDKDGRRIGPYFRSLKTESKVS